MDATICQLKQWGSKKIVVVSLIATVEGLAFLTKEHPDVELFVVSGDDTLDPDGRVLPGLGDAGDRQFFMVSSSLGQPKHFIGLLVEPWG